MSDLNEHNVKCTKFTCIALAIAFTVFVSAIAAYNIHSTAYESETLAAEVELVRAQAELETKQNELIQNLIDDGVNPIAARCAIIGWSRTEQATLCAFFGKDDNSIRD